MFLSIWRPARKIIQFSLKCFKKQNYRRFISLTPVLFPHQTDGSSMKETIIKENAPPPVKNVNAPRLIHSFSDSFTTGSLHILTLPARRNNLMYLIIDVKTKHAAVVDPFEVDLVLSYIREVPQINLSAILTTHHHFNHSGGNTKFVQSVENKLEVYGSDDRIPALTKTIEDGETIPLGGSTIKCIATPFHTTGDMCYFVESPQKDVHALFTGDTLFQAGCGSIIEGDYDDAYTALYSKLAQLPEDTLIFCGHENTVDNLLFAIKAEPKNFHTQRRIVWARLRRAGKFSTMPSTLREEKLWNPYLRVHKPSIQRFTKEKVSKMALHKLKDIQMQMYSQGQLPIP